MSVLVKKKNIKYQSQAMAKKSPFCISKIKLNLKSYRVVCTSRIKFLAVSLHQTRNDDVAALLCIQCTNTAMHP